MAADYSISFGDGGPPWVCQLSDGSGVDPDFIGSTVTLEATPVDGGPTLYLAADVVFATPSQVRYVPGETDFPAPGLYLARWKVAPPGAPELSFPSLARQLIEVTP